MKLTPRVLLYLITIFVVIASLVWEYYMQQWISYQPEDAAPVVRVDLFVIWPVVITLVSLSVFRLFFDKNKD
ncbi:hypothetical protein SCB49_02824 [unidentified eubacterium SCB49]|nr:hypothetical protein SCB49_02824 [unidentified eubacterium SCB49]